MEKVWNSKFTHILGLICLTLVLANCSKSKNSTATAATSAYVTCPSTGYYTNNGVTTACTPGSTVYTGTTSTTTGYITCPSTGYYVNNGVTYSCTVGSTVYVGGTTATTGYTTCPSSGYYVSNGVTYTCAVGTTVYIGSNTTTNTSGSSCAQYTAYYGISYVLVNYGGQYVCMRSDLVGYY